MPHETLRKIDLLITEDNANGLIKADDRIDFICELINRTKDEYFYSTGTLKDEVDIIMHKLKKKYVEIKFRKE